MKELNEQELMMVDGGSMPGYPFSGFSYWRILGTLTNLGMKQYNKMKYGDDIA
ncbi:lactobin A/cerein 7B family class IIb bacteriocin [Orenia metallireducens]|uniref:Class IIb bacteriocin, lactobin A/cerein 7B family n=1 Tax=Orenia metallireducens TaxID=1413210 RepID=A0A285HDX1_9FIRM|nr:hypothetical protein [Orenia metallireducens]PRX28988.1 lactobin A/cerein 7B family class IIb bacteriocin [Orenia metallireducens]SNY33036.1 class IIb bacteriocin, lactobin A/cerein 7B family [Orenia metallireducens]